MNQSRSLQACGVLVVAALLSVTPAQAGLDATTAQSLRAAISGEHRSELNRARDVYRKPFETLEFLGLRSDMTVVEIWPGGGWYSEILAPVLKDNGKFYAAQYNANGPYGYQRRAFGTYLTMLGSRPDIYRNVTVTEFDLPYALRIAPPESVDLVLTFRNVHNLVMEMNGGGVHAHLAMQAAFDALKPGGTFGVVDHEWDNPDTEDPLSANGYISRQRTIDLATRAGFELVAASEILKNPRDTRDHPRGVWTLPPSFALGDQERGKYAAIGESDRFLLRFIKPASAE